MPANSRVRVLTLGHPLIPLSEDACGGAEQVAHQILKGLQATHQLEFDIDSLPALSPGQSYDPGALAALERRYHLRMQARVREYANADRPYDLIHDHSALPWQRAEQLHAAVLITLHRARALYPDGFLDGLPENVTLQCVSHEQWRRYAQEPSLTPRLAGWIGNGVDSRTYRPAATAPAPGAPLLYLGRICFEKGTHLAIRIAERTRRPLWIVGGVYPFPSHRRYFRSMIQPALGRSTRWFAKPPLKQRVELLRSAAAVLIPSLVDETSSLVAMEAAACGVPALAHRIGALPEIVADGETGWLGTNWEELADAVSRLPQISPRACRDRAKRHFSSQRMIREYAALYRRLANNARA